MRSLLPWARRSDFEALTASLSASLETLRREFEVQAALHAAHSTSRADHLGRQLEQLGSDLTEMVGLRLEENAATHDLLASRIAHADAALGSVESQVNALGSTVASLFDDAASRRANLHRALAWYPTWSAMAPLCSEPLVSVIVPTRNRRLLLDTALTSLECQTYSKWEAVVVNDGSSDDTSEYLRRRAATDERIRPTDAGGVGCGAARQFGLEQARGDVIAYLDDDNLMADGWLRAVVEVFGRRPELDAVYGGQLREVDAPRPWMLLEPFDELRLLEGNFIDMGAFAHRPMPEIRFRADVDGLEDWDFILSISKHHRIAPVPVIASVYLERASGRLTLAPDHHRDERTVRAAAVRERLADPSFVGRAVRSLPQAAGERALSAPGDVTANDAESLAVAIRNVAQGRGAPVRLLAWAIGDGVGDLRQQLDALGVLAEWFAVGADEDPLADEASFDSVLVDGGLLRRANAGMRDTLADGGVAFVHDPDPSMPELGAEVFESWQALGDEWWIGSNVRTDFADVVPFRAFLRGITRVRPT